MFGWRTRSDRDAVAAAQRRLAALAAQFSGSGAETAGADTGRRGADRAGQAQSVDVGAQATSGDTSIGAGKHLGRATGGGAPRWTLSAQHVAILALVAVALVSVAAWWVLRSQPHAQPVQLSSQRFLPGDAAPGAQAPSRAADLSASVSASDAGVVGPVGVSSSASSTAGVIIVDVAGKVRHPGIVELPGGSRVVDALGAAGGPKPGVDTRSLNLARMLVDGEQIVVGFDVPTMPSEATSTGSPPASTEQPVQRVDLNTATAEQLDTLPDIGPVTAQSILTWREQNGAFTSVDELLEVSGIGDATLADVAPYVYV